MTNRPCPDDKAPPPRTVTVTVRWDRRHEEGHDLTLADAIAMVYQHMRHPDYDHLTIEMGNQD